MDREAKKMESFVTKKQGCYEGKSFVMGNHTDKRLKKRISLSPKHLRYRGIALVWTALVITVILLIVGLSLDVAKVWYNVHELQNATDSASLAGAQIVKISPPDDTRLFTRELGLANKAEHLAVSLRTDPVQPEPFTGDQYSFDILIGRWVRYNRTFVPTLDSPNAVQAIARRNASMGIAGPALNLIFGPLAGVDTADAATLAVAWCYNSGGAGLICLDTYATPGLLIGGNADLDIDGGGIHVNSEASGNNSSDATWIYPGADIDAGYLNVVGGVDPPPDDAYWEEIFEGGGSEGFSVCDESTTPSPSYLADPVAANMVGHPLVAPNSKGVYDHIRPELIGTSIPTKTYTIDETPIPIPTDRPIDFSCTLEPGYYPYGLSISTGVDITLAPTSNSGLGTIFVFGGTGGSPRAGLVMNGGNLTGEGVTCYVTKNITTGQYGEITVTGGALNLWSPGDWTNKVNNTSNVELVNGLNGIAVWQDPMMVYQQGNKDIHPEVHLNGNGEFYISGTLYFPDPIHARLEGDLGQAGNQIICGSADLLGGAIITVNYDTRNMGATSAVCLCK